MHPKKVPAGQFKNSCLRLIDEVRRQGTTIIVTKRGKDIVKIIPIRDEKETTNLIGTVLYAADALHSTGENWGADR